MYEAYSRLFLRLGQTPSDGGPRDFWQFLAHSNCYNSEIYSKTLSKNLQTTHHKLRQKFVKEFSENSASNPFKIFKKYQQKVILHCFLSICFRTFSGNSWENLLKSPKNIKAFESNIAINKFVCAADFFKIFIKKFAMIFFKIFLEKLFWGFFQNSWFGIAFLRNSGVECLEAF